MIEMWRPVLGQEGNYEVSNLGSVRSLNRKVLYKDGRVGNFKGKMLTKGRGNEGYLGVSLKDGRRSLVHRLVAQAFLPAVEGCNVVNHLNGDKRDNRAENLEWGTHQSNNRHARDTGLCTQHAENCNLTKFSSEFVAAVRRVHERYRPKYSELALLFDISNAQAADIIKGRTRRRG